MHLVTLQTPFMRKMLPYVYFTWIKKHPPSHMVRNSAISSLNSLLQALKSRRIFLNHSLCILLQLSGFKDLA